MPSANSIRKEILQALEDHILPSLWQPNMPIGNVVPPLEFAGNINARLLTGTVPRKDTSDVDFPLQHRWPSANLHSSHFPYLGFLYEGAADEKTIVTAEQAAKHGISKGVYAIRWNAPSALLFPPGAPRRGGADITFWEGTTPAPPMKILWISIWSELLIHTHIHDTHRNRHVSHSLHINDPVTITLAGLFVNELQAATSENQQLPQATLLSMMLSLHRNLRTTRPKLGNTSRSPIPALDAPFRGEHASEACREAAIYIQMRLHEPLSLSDIALQVHFSPTHLNRLFRRFYGTSVMQYVRRQRIAAAKGILRNGSENIGEIAQLAGFKRANLFCKVFREETGLTPSQFRNEARRSKSTF